MKQMKPSVSRILLLTTLISCSTALLPSARGQGRGAGGRGGFQAAIHTLFANHEKIKRTVEMTDTGYKARTVSDDPEGAKTLRKHVQEMRERRGGMMIRHWDPAFAELVEHYKDLEHEFREVDGGVEMIAKGKTPEAIKVAQNHARIISGFVEKGPAQMHQTHARALDDSRKETAQKAQDAEAGCPQCAAAAKPEAPNGTKGPGAKTGCPNCNASAEPDAPSVTKEPAQPK
jgi:hypothetical protein